MQRFFYGIYLSFLGEKFMLSSDVGAYRSEPSQVTNRNNLCSNAKVFLWNIFKLSRREVYA